MVCKEQDSKEPSLSRFLKYNLPVLGIESVFKIASLYFEVNSETWHPFVHFFVFLLKDQQFT